MCMCVCVCVSVYVLVKLGSWEGLVQDEFKLVSFCRNEAIVK